MKKILLASDHAGYSMKEEVKVKLEAAGYSVVDYGCNSEDSCDYPDFIHPLAKEIDSDKDGSMLGFIFCGSANGVSMTANKHQGVRAALCWEKTVAVLAREHNDANICSVPARFISKDTIFSIVDAFLATDFEGGRHQLRVDKIAVK